MAIQFVSWIRLCRDLSDHVTNIEDLPRISFLKRCAASVSCKWYAEAGLANRPLSERTAKKPSRAMPHSSMGHGREILH